MGELAREDIDEHHIEKFHLCMLEAFKLNLESSEELIDATQASIAAALDTFKLSNEMQEMIGKVCIDAASLVDIDNPKEVIVEKFNTALRQQLEYDFTPSYSIFTLN